MKEHFDVIFKMVDRWKANSLLDDKGFLWTEEPIWAQGNIERFRVAFIDNPDTTSSSFYEKLEKQLANEERSVYKYVIELMYLYFSVTGSISYKTKLERLHMIASWKDIDIEEIPADFFQALEKGIASTGGGYNTNIYNEIKMLHTFSESLKAYPVDERKAIMSDPKRLKELNEATREKIGFRAQMQHMIQFYILPDYFEWIANWGHKEKVVKSFNYLLKDNQTDDLDENIYHIKESLKRIYGDDIDFYLSDIIRHKWYPNESKEAYFKINTNPKVWSIDQIKVNETMEFSVDNEDGKRKKEEAAFEQIKLNDKLVIYETSPTKKVLALGEVTAGIHFNDNDEKVITIKLLKHHGPISWSEMEADPILKESRFVKNGNHGTLIELKKEEYDVLLNWHEVDHAHDALTEYESHPIKEAIPFEKIQLQPEDSGLVFENEEVLYSQIETALKKGDHIILTGPPGTGKSKLAKAICQAYGVESKMVTASSNWSTYDTIGGYRPNRDGQLQFDPGIFLDAVKDKETGEQKNEWLIIDEMNRADIDKAFGSLFSVLTGDTVQLPYEADNGKKVTLKMEGGQGTQGEEEYRIPKDWRIIGTMNTIDKASLFEMSYAFMRRFAFIPVAIPRYINDTLIDSYLSMWGIHDYPFTSQLTAIWKLINAYRKIGPAIVRDIALYTNESEDFVSAIILYVLPQFEGLSDMKVNQFVEQLADLEDIIPDTSLLEDFVEDFFQQGDF